MTRLQDIAELERSDELLVGVAQSLQLTKTEHENNTQRYEALAEFIDAQGSVLHNKVVSIFPSGSNAIDAAIRGLIRDDAPDVDAVIVLDIPATTPPQRVLDLVKDAITRGGSDQSKYRDCKVEAHSRCITVIYADDSTVDLMPVVQLTEDEFAPIMQLFHYDDETSPTTSYVKKVSPIGFKNAVKTAVEAERGSWLYENVSKSLRLGETLLLEKAEVEGYPEQKQLEEKAPRIVVLQLLKRFRDIRFRHRKDRRKPPSVVLAAMAIKAPFLTRKSMIDEIIHVAEHMRREIEIAGSRRLDVRNPGYNEDVFTDRWPVPGTNDQSVWHHDLSFLISELMKLKSTVALNQQAEILEQLFGQKVAKRAVGLVAKKDEHSRRRRGLSIAPSGASVISTNEGPRTVSSSERFGGPTR